MNWRLPGLLATLCLASACKEEPVGQMEPIPRPPELPGPAPQAAAETPAPASAPEPDPSKVVLRWKLAVDAPAAFRLTTRASSSEEAPAPRRKRGRKPPPSPRTQETSSVYLLQQTESGDYTFRIAPQGQLGEAEQGSMSGNGFVLDGLSGLARNTAVLVLELPLEPVGMGDTWSLGADLVDFDSGLPGFVEQRAERRNEVKLVSLTPADDGEQVATLEYELFEQVSGVVREAAAGKPADDHDDHGDHDVKEAPRKAGPEKPVSAEVRVKGRGEFLVKAGHWRSWEGTVTASHQGPRPEGGASDGELQLRLTPLEKVPPELLAPQAKK